MDTNDPFELWKRQRAGANAPAGFADGVMREVRTEAARQNEATWAARLLRVFNQSLAARVAFCSLAAAAFLLRVGSVLDLWIVQ